MAVDSNESPVSELSPKPGHHDLDIDVLGASFSITADEAPEYLNGVLEEYRLAVSSTQGISGMKDPLKVAILTGFLLCEQISKLKAHAEEDQSAAEQALDRTRDLILRLDGIIDSSRAANG
jgi:cell division protein ZapA (FtsZ GTPase activity inhibitor)